MILQVIFYISTYFHHLELPLVIYDSLELTVRLPESSFGFQGQLPILKPLLVQISYQTKNSVKHMLILTVTTALEY